MSRKKLIRPIQSNASPSAISGGGAITPGVSKRSAVMESKWPVPGD
jgi:hypothetical protein